MEQLQDYVKSKKFFKAREILKDMNAVDIAGYLEEIDDKDMLILFRLLPKDQSVDVFSYMQVEEQEYIINSITDKEIGTIVEELFLDDTVDIIEELPATVVEKILSNTSKEKRRLINQYLNYPDDSAGSLMTIEYVSLKKEMTVKEAIATIKKGGVDKETIDTCYVTDSTRKIEGVISIRKLILSDDDVKLKDIMGTNIITINTKDDREYVADTFRKYDFYTMPVVDKESRLVGIITLDDIVDIIELENTEDFHKMAAISPSEVPYLKTSVFKLAKNRIIWLLILMIPATFTGKIIGSYESVLNKVVILTSFIPMLMDTGGNSGAQSSTLIIRSMALGEIQTKDILKVVFKELRVGLLIGVGLGAINLVRIYFLEPGANFLISLTVALTVAFTVVLAKLVGGLLPIGAKVLKLDPAIMASPLITTIVDVAALVVYFNVATRLLNI